MCGKVERRRGGVDVALNEQSRYGQTEYVVVCVNNAFQLLPEGHPVAQFVHGDPLVKLRDGNSVFLPQEYRTTLDIVHNLTGHNTLPGVAYWKKQFELGRMPIQAICEAIITLEPDISPIDLQAKLDVIEKTYGPQREEAKPEIIVDEIADIVRRKILRDNFIHTPHDSLEEAKQMAHTSLETSLATIGTDVTMGEWLERVAKGQIIRNITEDVPRSSYNACHHQIQQNDSMREAINSYVTNDIKVYLSEFHSLPDTFVGNRHEGFWNWWMNRSSGDISQAVMGPRLTESGIVRYNFPIEMQKYAQGTSSEAIISVFEEMGISPKHWQQYILRMAFQQPGLHSYLKHYQEHGRFPLDFTDIIAARMITELGMIKEVGERFGFLKKDLSTPLLEQLRDHFVSDWGEWVGRTTTDKRFKNSLAYIKPFMQEARSNVYWSDAGVMFADGTHPSHQYKALTREQKKQKLIAMVLSDMQTKSAQIEMNGAEEEQVLSDREMSWILLNASERRYEQGVVDQILRQTGGLQERKERETSAEIEWWQCMDDRNGPFAENLSDVMREAKVPVRIIGTAGNFSIDQGRIVKRLKLSDEARAEIQAIYQKVLQHPFEVSKEAFFQMIEDSPCYQSDMGKKYKHQIKEMFREIPKRIHEMAQHNPLILFLYSSFMLPIEMHELLRKTIIPDFPQSSHTAMRVIHQFEKLFGEKLNTEYHFNPYLPDEENLPAWVQFHPFEKWQYETAKKRLVETGDPIYYVQLREYEAKFARTQKAQMVYNQLESMGALNRKLGKLIVVQGHGSSSTNNPLEACHNCGAAGHGHTGRINMEQFVEYANDPEIRELLKQYGIYLDETLFIGSYYDTAKVKNSMYVPGEIPDTHKIQIAQTMQFTEEADKQTRMFRLSTLPNPWKKELRMLGFTDEQILERMASDPSRVTPEWGHAGVAGIFIGNFSRIQGIKMDGRMFHLNVDTHNPEHLKKIFSVYGRIAQGIAGEYLASSADVYGPLGASEKAYHSATGGFGGWWGLQHGPDTNGDTRPGLPLGMVLRHEPKRLSFFIEANMTDIQNFLQNNPDIQRQMDGGWLRVVVIDDQSNISYRYENGQWQQMQVSDESIPIAIDTRMYMSN